MPNKEKLEAVFGKVIKFLEKYKIPYFIIGGIAAGVLGEPRATGDVDINIKLKKNFIKDFLRYADKAGFTFDESEVMQKVKETGTFKFWYGGFHIDFIISSTQLEENALKRMCRIKLFGIMANFPSPEDLLLSKIVSGRAIDIFDAENIAKRYQGKLDKKYLLDWAMKLSDQAEDLRIYNEVKRLLRQGNIERL